MTTRVESLETVIDSIKEFIEKETGNTTDHNPIDRRDPGNVVFVTFSSTHHHLFRNNKGPPGERSVKLSCNLIDQ